MKKSVITLKKNFSVFNAGESITVPEEDATELIKKGIAEAGAKKPKKKKPAGEAKPADADKDADPAPAL
jgi:hypothetical protein